ncbi:hypothetical protein A2U01_0085167 [Trifolium medium]|uniref:Uncharacterized protein n=1 Tax=Trifolium medium TaxID=97028 RepID=A0A392TUF0_9FABA|nr:hypothetical protein [Trifolium medium]
MLARRAISSAQRAGYRYAGRFEILLLRAAPCYPRAAPMPERIPVGLERTVQCAIEPCATRTYQKRSLLLAK